MKINDAIIQTSDIFNHFIYSGTLAVRPLVNMVFDLRIP